MDGSLDQLMRLLANRGLEWLRQRIMELPDPCPLDHPDLAALAQAGRVAPILTGLRGRISPLEVIVQRRLTPALVRQAAIPVLDGARDGALVDLMLAGALMSQSDPLWQMACETLAEDEALPLAQRLALTDDADLLARAETAMTAPPALITRDHVAHVCDLVMQRFQFGARRPVLSGPRAFAQLFDHLQQLSAWARRANCTPSHARIAFCLALVDPGHDLSDLMSDLIQVQRPDGSFPPRLGFSTADQTFSQGVAPTLLVSMALHMGAYRRWRGARPIWLVPRPLRDALREGARTAAALAPPGTSLEGATILTRATGENWLQRLSPATPATLDLGRLAELAFRDPIVARHLRQWLSLGRAVPPTRSTADTVHERWLRGAPVTLRGPVPPSVAALWERAALRQDDEVFMHCARLALHHDDLTPAPVIRRAVRRLAARALMGCHAPSLDQALPHLERLTVLSQVFDIDDRMAAAA